MPSQLLSCPDGVPRTDLYSSTYGTILQARQEIARWVFSQHFGQKASVIEHDFQHDGGFKGGRGGRGGKRGRGRW